MRLREKAFSFYKSLTVLFLFVIFDVGFAFAQSGAAPKELSFPQRLVAMLPMVAIIFGIFYFLVILPQRKQEIEFTKLVDNLKKGDNVVTKSGIIGKVSNIAKDVVTLEVAKDTKVKFKKDCILSAYEG